MGVEYNPGIITDGLVSLYDTTNIKSFSPNVHPYPTDLYTWCPTGSGAVFSRDTITSPVGNKPLKMVATGGDPQTTSYNSSVYWNLANTTVGDVWKASVWVKANGIFTGANTGQIFMFGANTSGSVSPSGINQWLDISSTNIPFTTNWVRVSSSITIANSNTTSIQVRLDGPSGVPGVIAWFDGLQVERSSAVTKFNPNKGNITLTDIVSNNNMTIVGTCAYDGASLKFPDSNTSYIINNSYPFPSNNYSVDCWFKIPSFTQPVQAIYTYSDNSNTNYLLCITNTPTSLQVWYNTGAQTIPVTNMQNVWCNFTRTRNRVSEIENYYFNGDLVAYSTIANTSIPTNGIFVIGQDIDNFSINFGFDSSQNLDGYVSKLAIYNRDLSSEEVKINFNALRGRYGI